MVEKKKKTATAKVAKADVAKSDVALQRHDTDTWSPEVQIWILSDDIKMLQEHVNINKKDFDAKRSLLKKVARRRRLMKFLKDTNLERYMVTAKKLWLKI